MDRRILVGATVVLVSAGALSYFLLARRAGPHTRPLSSGPSEHGNGMDHAMGAVLAEYRAPTGSTPCESAYNAFSASVDYSTEQNAIPVVTRLAPRDEFLQRCSALPSATQVCLVPLYMAKHRAECDKARPPAGALAPMIELKTVGARGFPDDPEMPSGGSR